MALRCGGNEKHDGTVWRDCCVVLMKTASMRRQTRRFTTSCREITGKGSCEGPSSSASSVRLPSREEEFRWYAY
eukprot:4766934-Pleurochrysis_carterae.AAC.2